MALLDDLGSEKVSTRMTRRVWRIQRGKSED